MIIKQEQFFLPALSVMFLFTIIGMQFSSSKYDWATPLAFGLIPMTIGIFIVFPFLLYMGYEIEKSVILPKPGYYKRYGDNHIFKLSYSKGLPKIDTGKDFWFPRQFKYIQVGLLVKDSFLFWNGIDGELPQDTEPYVYIKNQEDVSWNVNAGFKIEY